MLASLMSRPGRIGDGLINASRQAWLASLGVVVVTRDWAEKEAGNVLRALVKEGTAVESHAIRVVGNRVETSFLHANALWKKTRATVETGVRNYADTAVAFVNQALPKSLPRIAIPVPAKRAVATPRKAAARKTAAKRPGARRVAKKAAKR
jgi:hypothetical protein